MDEIDMEMQKIEIRAGANEVHAAWTGAPPSLISAETDQVEWLDRVPEPASLAYRPPHSRVSKLNESVGQVRHDALGAAIQAWRHRLI
jgi:hypothetical protein